MNVNSLGSLLLDQKLNSDEQLGNSRAVSLEEPCTIYILTSHHPLFIPLRNTSPGVTSVASLDKDFILYWISIYNQI